MGGKTSPIRNSHKKRRANRDRGGGTVRVNPVKDERPVPGEEKALVFGSGAVHREGVWEKFLIVFVVHSGFPEMLRQNGGGGGKNRLHHRQGPAEEVARHSIQPVRNPS